MMIKMTFVTRHDVGITFIVVDSFFFLLLNFMSLFTTIDAWFNSTLREEATVATFEYCRGRFDWIPGMYLFPFTLGIFISLVLLLKLSWHQHVSGMLSH